MSGLSLVLAGVATVGFGVVAFRGQRERDGAEPFDRIMGWGVIVLFALWTWALNEWLLSRFNG